MNADSWWSPQAAWDLYCSLGSSCCRLSGHRESWSVSIPVVLDDSIQALWIPDLRAQGLVQVLKVFSDGRALDSDREHLILEGSLTGKSLVMIDLGNLEGVREVLIRGNDYASDRIRAALIPALR